MWSSYALIYKSRNRIFILKKGYFTNAIGIYKSRNRIFILKEECLIDRRYIYKSRNRIFILKNTKNRWPQNLSTKVEIEYLY